MCMATLDVEGEQVPRWHNQIPRQLTFVDHNHPSMRCSRWNCFFFTYLLELSILSFEYELPFFNRKRYFQMRYIRHESTSIWILNYRRKKTLLPRNGNIHVSPLIFPWFSLLPTSQLTSNVWFYIYSVFFPKCLMQLIDIMKL